jgi:hypothetical protein
MAMTILHVVLDIGTVLFTHLKVIGLDDLLYHCVCHDGILGVVVHV